MLHQDVDVTFEGDNTVLMQQVARALMDDKTAVGAALAAAAAPARVPLAAALAQGGPAALASLERLLAARQGALLAQVAGAAAAAARAAAGRGKGVVADAAAAAFDDNLDVVVNLGWAFVDRHCSERFAAAIGAAPPATRPAVAALQLLYAASRVERNAGCYLSTGLLGPQDVAALRTSVNGMCRALGSGGRDAPALVLCAAWGIPDHLLWNAPIATDWRKA